MNDCFQNLMTDIMISLDLCYDYYFPSIDHKKRIRSYSIFKFFESEDKSLSWMETF